ncbi:MAG: GNAT family N-acetyltransferase [Actinobacteria bacterium]|nr:GNAT family N-acetyltransferase [Actinomycetota bacterium]
MIVREATREDFEELFDVFESVAAEKKWIGQETPLDREGRISTWNEYLEVEGSVMLVAEDEGKLVGMATLKNKGPADLGMLVAQDSRGHGIGTALLEACIAWARANGHYKITLQTWPHNQPAITLYERYGFEREGYLRKHWRRKSGELWDSVVMGLVLED